MAVATMAMAVSVPPMAVATAAMTVSALPMAVATAAMTVSALSMAVAMVMIMPTNTMMVVATQNKEVEHINGYSSQCQEKHEFAVDWCGVYDAVDCFCYQDAGDGPAAQN